MSYTDHELLRLTEDTDEDQQTRATALLMLLPEVQKLPDLLAAAKSQDLEGQYLALKAAIPELLEKSDEKWRVKEQPRMACKEKIRERIRKDTKIWVIHGGKSRVWEEVATFLSRTMHLCYVEFNDPESERVFIQQRVQDMALSSSLALAIMTCEDELESGRLRARQNVIHEIGVAQGRLGFDRVIVMREQSIDEFSNINGIVYVAFERANLSNALTDLRSHIEARLGLS